MSMEEYQEKGLGNTDMLECLMKRYGGLLKNLKE